MSYKTTLCSARIRMCLFFVWKMRYNMVSPSAYSHRIQTCGQSSNTACRREIKYRKVNKTKLCSRWISSDGKHHLHDGQHFNDNAKEMTKGLANKKPSNKTQRNSMFEKRINKTMELLLQHNMLSYMHDYTVISIEILTVVQ